MAGKARKQGNPSEALINLLLGDPAMISQYNRTAMKQARMNGIATTFCQGLYKACQQAWIVTHGARRYG